jgi:hypothetical protein
VPKGQIDQEKLDYIIANYRKHFEFSWSLEHGISAFNLTIDSLEENTIKAIRDLLEEIADQLSAEPKRDLSECIADLKIIIEKMQSNPDKEIASKVFRSLKEVPPDPDLDKKRTRRPHSCPKTG